jgi:battenin
MFLIALTPDYKSGGSISLKLFGVCLASLSSGAGELSFLGLTHYYGHFSLAAWGSGTGGAGLIGAGLYVLLTSIIGLSVRNSLLSCAFLPFIMLIAFFAVLPQGPLRRAHANGKDYTPIPSVSIDDDEITDLPTDTAAQSLLASGPGIAAEAYSSHSPRPSSPTGRRSTNQQTLWEKINRAKSLFIPYMAPLLLVYIAEYTINQGVTPTLLFPLHHTPFDEYRSFYPVYAFLYQLGVFISRSSTPFIRIHNLYLPSFLQVGNLILLIIQSLYNIFGDTLGMYIVFIIIFWEGLLGGAVYVNTFAEIMEKIDEGEREFSLGATSVSDSGGICIAGFIGMVVEPWLCGRQVANGRAWCRGK